MNGVILLGTVDDDLAGPSTDTETFLGQNTVFIALSATHAIHRLGIILGVVKVDSSIIDPNAFIWISGNRAPNESLTG